MIIEKLTNKVRKMPIVTLYKKYQKLDASLASVDYEMEQNKAIYTANEHAKTVIEVYTDAREQNELCVKERVYIDGRAFHKHYQPLYVEVKDRPIIYENKQQQLDAISEISRTHSMIIYEAYTRNPQIVQAFLDNEYLESVNENKLLLRDIMKSVYKEREDELLVALENKTKKSKTEKTTNIAKRNDDEMKL